MLHLCLRWPLPTPKLWLRVISLVVLLTGIVLFSVPASAASYPSDASVVGKWNLIVTFPDGHTEASQVIFNRNGVFVNLTPGPGGGKWFPTEQDLTFRYIFSESILVNGTFTALVEVQQTGKLSTDGSTFTAEGTGSVYDPTTGNLFVVNHTTTVATRAS